MGSGEGRETLGGDGGTETVIRLYCVSFQLKTVKIKVDCVKLRVVVGLERKQTQIPFVESGVYYSGSVSGLIIDLSLGIRQKQYNLWRYEHNGALKDRRGFPLKPEEKLKHEKGKVRERNSYLRMEEGGQRGLCREWPSEHLSEQIPQNKGQNWLRTTF